MKKFFIIVSLLICFLLVGCVSNTSESELKPKASTNESKSTTVTSEERVDQSESDVNNDEPQLSTDDSIYSYLQGIKSYEKGLKWAGDWSQIEAGGQLFSSFGCGICCIANVYSTLTETAHDPNEMYEYAVNNSSYNPSSGVGAISWSQLQTVAESLGIKTELMIKPATCEEFVNLAANNTTLLVLVSSNNDDAIWVNVPGHYVNIWNYNEEDNTVFLTDSKGPKNNRSRVKLEDVYNALKTSSEYQIMVCN